MKYNIIPIIMATCVCSDSTCFECTLVCDCCLKCVCYNHNALAEYEEEGSWDNITIRICYECLAIDRRFRPDNKLVACSSICFDHDVKLARRWKASTALITKAIR